MRWVYTSCWVWVFEVGCQKFTTGWPRFNEAIKFVPACGLHRMPLSGHRLSSALKAGASVGFIAEFGETRQVCCRAWLLNLTDSLTRIMCSGCGAIRLTS